MKTKKFYVVWIGRQPGIYGSWVECQTQINGFHNARHKSFPTRQLAEQAFCSDSKAFIGKPEIEIVSTDGQRPILGDPILESIAVDGAWDTSTGRAEYQGVDTKTRQVIFKQGPFEEGTNNIVEFLAIVHALAHCKKHKLTVPIYSDSRNAINWVKDKHARTRQERTDKNKKIFDLLDRAISWLHENEYHNPILKWETKAWGENPADFGRK